MIETVKKYWFLVSTVLLAIVYFLMDRKNQNLEYTLNELRRKSLIDELKRVEEKSQGSEENYEKARREYEALRRRHGGLIDKFGLRDLGEGPDAS